MGCSLPLTPLSLPLSLLRCPRLPLPLPATRDRPAPALSHNRNIWREASDLPGPVAALACAYAQSLDVPPADANAPLFSFPASVSVRVRRHHLQTFRDEDGTLVELPIERLHPLSCPSDNGRPQEWSLGHFGAKIKRNKRIRFQRALRRFRRHPREVAHVPLRLVIICEPDGEISELSVQPRVPLVAGHRITSRACRRLEGYYIQVFFHRVDQPTLDAFFYIGNMPRYLPIEHMN